MMQGVHEAVVVLIFPSYLETDDVQLSCASLSLSSNFTDMIDIGVPY